MSVDFLTEEQKACYGQFADEPSEEQLARYFHLDENDLAFISSRRGDANRLGFSLQLTCVRFLGTFPANISQIPLNVQVFVAQQLSINNVSVLLNYAQRDITKWEHSPDIS